MPLAEAKSAVEQAIADMNFTVIEASYFQEVWLSPHTGFDPFSATARVYGEGTSPISWVSSRDVAEMCVRALDSPGASRRTIPFGGPEAVAPLDVIKRFEAISGKTFQVERVPVAALMQQFASAQDSMTKSFAALMLGFAHGDAMDMGSVQAEFGLHLVSIDEYAREILQA